MFSFHFGSFWLMHLLQLLRPCPPTPITAMFSRPEGEQLIMFGIKTAPAPKSDADLIKSLLDVVMTDISLELKIESKR
jgi:hypothetical protein